MCPGRNVLKCFVHENGLMVVTVLICIVFIYVVYNSSASPSDKRKAEESSAGTEPGIEASNDHAHAEQLPSNAPSDGLSWFKLAALLSPVWAPPLLALLMPMLQGRQGIGLIMFSLFILPFWGVVVLFKLPPEPTIFTFLVAMAYYVAAVAITFVIGGLVLVLIAGGLH